MKKGLFITFEGPEAAGKTTQIRLLEERLKEEGHKVQLSREPGGTKLAEKLREIVKYSEEKLSDEVEYMIFATARAHHVSELIIPTTNKGTHLLCDRYEDSSKAYQGYGRGLSLDKLKYVHQFASKGFMPDLTFLIDLTVEESFKRIDERTMFLSLHRDTEKKDRIESEKIEFHKRMRNGFLDIAKNDPHRVKVIDGLKSIEEIHKEVLGYTLDKLKNY